MKRRGPLLDMMVFEPATSVGHVPAYVGSGGGCGAPAGGAVAHVTPASETGAASIDASIGGGSLASVVVDDGASVIGSSCDVVGEPQLATARTKASEMRTRARVCERRANPQVGRRIHARTRVVDRVPQTGVGAVAVGHQRQ